MVNELDNLASLLFLLPMLYALQTSVNCAMQKSGHAAVRSFVITSALFLDMFSDEKESIGRLNKSPTIAKELELNLFATSCKDVSLFDQLSEMIVDIFNN